MNVNKQFYKSKTMWAAILIAVSSAVFPEAKEIIKEHPDYAMGVVTFIFGLLRADTKTAITFKK